MDLIPWQVEAPRSRIGESQGMGVFHLPTLSLMLSCPHPQWQSPASGVPSSTDKDLLLLPWDRGQTPEAGRK